MCHVLDFLFAADGRAQEFDDLVFHGGIDLQRALVGTREQAIEETNRRIADYASDAGWNEWNMAATIGSLLVAVPGLAHLFCGPASFTRNRVTGEIDFLSSQPANAADERTSGIDVGALYYYYPGSGDKPGTLVEGNVFEGNIDQVAHTGGRSTATLTWRGNSWDDYQGFDRNGDGIGDTPYELYAFAVKV